MISKGAVPGTTTNCSHGIPTSNYFKLAHRNGYGCPAYNVDQVKSRARKMPVSNLKTYTAKCTPAVSTPKSNGTATHPASLNAVLSSS